MFSPSATKGGRAFTPLCPEQTTAWAIRYRKHSKIWACSFFMMVVPIIFGVIWWEVGEITIDVVYSFGFTVIVMFALAVWSRRGSNAGWTGEVVKKTIREVREDRKDEQIPRIASRFLMTVHTRRGKRETIRLTQELFQYFDEGDAVFKVPGFEWPEKVNVAEDERICVVCGNLMLPGSGQCPRCRAPEPDHGALKTLAGAD